MIDIAKNLEEVQQKIDRAVQKSPSKSNVTLVAVTKNHPAEMVKTAIDHGVKNIGENRIQEAVEKFSELDLTGVTKHLIGHLQTNKVKKAVENFDLIHSIDSEHLLNAIAKSAETIGKIQDVLIQINLVHEETKSGIDLDSLDSLIKLSQTLSNIRLRGLMFIAPNFENIEQTRPLFKKMFNIFTNLQNQARDNDFRDCDQIKILSMGMTHDFEIAIEEGATHVRIGTGIFGVRNYEGG